VSFETLEPGSFGEYIITKQNRTTPHQIEQKKTKTRSAQQLKSIRTKYIVRRVDT
jgi:hypothetical protein